MPLHLLGKKSWNVYNTANIEKVRRDEAALAALEAAEEERMQDLDAQRRMQILRGEIPTPLAIEDAPSDPNPNSNPDRYGKRGREPRREGRERKRRKRAGENDTDFEMRVIREERDAVRETGQQLVLRKDTEAPLLDHGGHIDLFPQPKPEAPKTAEKNAEAERETARKKQEYEDQYTMRFSNAAGFKQGLENPWYSTAGEREEESVGKDVWGNEDPRRRERQLKRVVDNDPLAIMKAGARTVREVKKEREKWREEKEKEVKELDDAERRERRKRRYEEDELEGFSLDHNEERGSSKRHRSRERESGRDRDRERRRHKESKRSSRSEREEGKHRHRHQSRYD
ncbi:homocitrate synthase [Diplocarpon rosae]|nr:homocitrate synthase [Diplocarpon rosae]